MTDSGPPFISIIIPAKNEEGYLGSCLAALAAQEYPKDRYETIVVDNGSTDRTVEIARQGAHVVLEHPGIRIGAMRNRGAEKARGSVLAFIDADCLAKPDWLSAIAAVLAREHCLTGSDCLLEDNPGWIAETWYCYQQRTPQAVTCLATNNLAVPRDVFDKIGGFNETLKTGEDCELCARARAHVRVVADPSIRVIHRGVPKTLKQFFRREIWHGLGAWGTFRQNLCDKPLVATLFFALSALLVCYGGLARLAGFGGSALEIGMIGLMGVLAASVFYRRQYLRGPRHALRWAALYAVYYAGRTVALLQFAVPKDFYHNMRSESSKTKGV